MALGHGDRERAKAQAMELAERFRTQESVAPRERTLSALFDNYLESATPSKTTGKQKHDRACAKMFLCAFGANRKPSTLSRREWDRFIAERKAGRIAPKRSRRTTDGKPRPVGNRVIAYDLSWLQAVLNWACRTGDGRGNAFLERNPLRGLPLPRTENPRRALVTDERYAKLLAVADRVHLRLGLLLVMAYETGHRGASIRKLRWSDVDLDMGRVHWRGENEKTGFDHRTPLTSSAVRALQKARRRGAVIGDGWIFPSDRRPDLPLSRHTIPKWIERAEELANLAHVSGLGLHGFRRTFATSTKNAPLRDVAYLGGWKDTKTLLTCYTAPDEQTQRDALAARKPVVVEAVS
jgi:integrase